MLFLSFPFCLCIYVIAIWEAVRHYGNALEYASEELRGDRGIALEAFRQDGNALEYASEELQTKYKNILTTRN